MAFERFNVFEPKFLNCSYGFRPDRNAHQAIEEVERLRDQGYWWTVDADIQSFFDTVDHKLLMKFVEEEVSDGSVLNLIRLFLKAGVLEEQRFLSDHARYTARCGYLPLAGEHIPSSLRH